MTIAVIMVGIPIYWMLLAAFKTNQEIFTAPPTWIPQAPTLDNFGAAWSQAPFGNFYANSLIYTLVSGTVKVLQAIFCGYAFAYLKFPHKNALFLLLLMALMIPDEFTVLPNFLTLALVGWTNTYQGLLLPGFVSAFGTFLMRQHFLSLPREVLDAARVDGAGHLRTLWNVVRADVATGDGHVDSADRRAALERLSVAADHHQFHRHAPAVGGHRAAVPEGNGHRVGRGHGRHAVRGAASSGAVLLVQRHIVEGIAAGAVKG